MAAFEVITEGPVDGQVELLSDWQRPVGFEAQAGAAHADSLTGPVFDWPTTARDAVVNLQVTLRAMELSIPASLG
jgi:hypothetical protein